MPHTAELQPEGFAELSPELAAELGIRTLDWIVLSTARGEIEPRALVTRRLRPLRFDGRIIHQVGIPWHFGREGEATGDIADVLTAAVGNPNEPRAMSLDLLHEAERTAGTRIEPGRAYGFFTDTSVCIGCKACEVACKEWNQLPAGEDGLSAMSYAASLRDPRCVRQVRRNARLLAMAGTAAGSALLIADLKTPHRFYNMPRIFWPSSPIRSEHTSFAPSGWSAPRPCSRNGPARGIAPCCAPSPEPRRPGPR